MKAIDLKCSYCGNQHEEFISESTFKDFINDKITFLCATCGRRMSRNYNAGTAPIIFKGDGFYDTDYKKRN